jgi:Fe(II)/alpha-ketoglutarate-dependent arginine beta-hydroxylase
MQMSSMVASVTKLTLTPDEAEAMRRLSAEAVSRHGSCEESAFTAQASLLAHELPYRVRRTLMEFRTAECAASCLISGCPVGDGIGATPRSWREADTPETRDLEMMFFLCASVLGEVFGWRSLQAGRLMHNVLPVKGDEEKQETSGSTSLLAWHTEDAFHPYRADYLGLMCLRNPDRVPTTFASIDGVGLEGLDLDVLFEPRFAIQPDTAHLENSRSDRPMAAGYPSLRQMAVDPPGVPVLFGGEDEPYLCIDPYFMRVKDPKDVEAKRVLDALTERLEAALVDVALEPGDIWFLDNYRSVHGRKPFTPRYDGSDRWMKKLVVTRDLRRSRGSRDNALARLV